jgi:hypothetical protein
MMDDKITMRANSTTEITHPMSYDQWLANAQAPSSPAIAEAYRLYLVRCKTDPAYLT